GSNSISNLYGQMEPCEKDDLVKFNADGSLISDEGATKCDADAPQTVSGTWVWNTDESIITITQDGTSQSFNILKNDGTTLQFTVVEEYGGTNYTVTYTYTKQ